MRGISFDYSRPLTPSDPNRMDIACFVGFVARRPVAPVPPDILDWLVSRRWLESEAAPGNDLRNMPVPIESWQAFQDVFAWEQRLDSRLVIAGHTLDDKVIIGDQERLFKIVLNGSEQEVQLDTGDYFPTELAAFLDARLDDIQVTAELSGVDSHLNLSYTGGRGQLTVFTHPQSGFPTAVSAGNAFVETYLGSAVQSFFAQGGRKCYVIRLGDPLPRQAGEAERIRQLGRLLSDDALLWSGATRIEQLLTAYIPSISLSQENPESWHGVEHLLGLGDVSYLNLPDLPELVSRTPQPLVHDSPPPSPEVFVPCSDGLATARGVQTAAGTAPQCDDSGYQLWSRTIRVLLRFVRGMARESHLVASLPQPGGELSQDFKSYVLDSWFAQAAPLAGGDIRSAFLQLCYPWLKTSLSDGLPQRALPPDGVLTGILAANALSQGVFNSAAGNRVLHGYDLFPAEFFTPADEQADSRTAFYRHVSVFARSPGGIELISDVTASRDESYRPAVVSRLMSLLVRAARNQGRSTLFEPMSHATWRAVEKSLSALLQGVFEAGGLRGVSAADAFDVQCDESTMSRNDMDNGRLIANLSFQPAIPVQRIQVALSLQQDGHVELQGAA